MKHGYYIRFVPSLNEYRFYVYISKGDLGLLVLDGYIFAPDDVQWREPIHSDPLPELGFEYVCNLEGE